MNRREFLAGSAAMVAAGGLTRSRVILGQAAGAPAVRVNVSRDQQLGRIPADFTGLGYEISSVAEPGLLSDRNATMVRLVRTLGREGVIRVGGDTSDYARYEPDGTPSDAPRASVVNRAVIRNLGAFLHATGWRLIWGLNLGRGTPDEAAEEAHAVAEAAGDRLLAIEIGNEPDLFAGRHRKREYGYADFLEEYRRFKAIVRARVPAVPLAGPDAAAHTDWVERFAADEGSDVKLLTHHHYSQGPPESPKTTIENLLAGPAGLPRTLARLQKLGAAYKLPYRFCEMNSCFHGGKPGVADTFASALWGLDIMLTMAWYDCGGVNIETGMNQLGVVSAYSPIYPDGKGGFVARPIYYGMLAFARAAVGVKLHSEIDAVGVNLKAYATRGDDGRVRVTLINKELERDVRVHVISGASAAKGTLLRLIAPSGASKDAVTLGGARVAADGTWEPAVEEEISVREGQLDVHLPAASSVIVEI